MAVLQWSPLVKFKDTLKGMSDTLKGTLKPINAVKDSMDKVKHTLEDYNKLTDDFFILLIPTLTSFKNCTRGPFCFIIGS